MNELNKHIERLQSLIVCLQEVELKLRRMKANLAQSIKRSQDLEHEARNIWQVMQSLKEMAEEK